jgi:arylsulfatase A-like enzyme
MKPLSLLAGWLVALCMVAPSAAAEGKRPNILFLFTDDHAAHAMSCYGSKINRTPNLDRIANEGMRFANCFCTNSLCGPSRAVILTGKHSHLNGFIDNRSTFDASQQTFPKLLQRSGYSTAVIGKWHLVSNPTGFDHYEILIGQGPYYNPPMIRDGERVQHTGYTTHVITDLALDWLKNQRDQDKPFLLMCQHKAPHREWQPGPEYFDLYKDGEIPEPATLFDDYAGRGTAAKTQDMSVEKTLNNLDLKLEPPKNLNPEQLATWHAAYDEENEEFRKANLQGKDLVRWKYQRYIKDYLRCVAAVDDSIGKLLAYLDESGLAENTIVVYSSDQGFYLGDHGWFDKRFMYEESLRMPLLVRWPGVTKPGSVNEDLVQNLDFGETFLEAAGVEIPRDMQGRSLVPLLKGETPSDWRESIYYQYYEYPASHAVQKHYGIRTAKHKLMHFYKINEWELYDLERDPDELQNIYEDSQSEQVVAELKEELTRLREQYQVPEDTEPVPGPGLTRWPEGQGPRQQPAPGGQRPGNQRPRQRRAE